MKKRMFIVSLTMLLVVSVALAVGMVMAKYKSTLPAGTIDFTTYDYPTYTYAVLDKDTGALSIRNRPAIIVENGTKLIDKDGTYDIATEIYELPDCFVAANVPTDAVSGAWNTGKNVSGTLEGVITSVMVEDEIALSDSGTDYMFQNFTVLKTVNLEKVNFSKATTLENMFDNCRQITSVTFAETIDTSNVTNMYGMFVYCAKLQTVNVSGFDTGNVTSMMNMFRGCEKVTALDVSNFDTSKVENMQEMFKDCKTVTTLDVSNFKVTNVTTFREMFYYCSKLTSLDLTKWGENKATSTHKMFSWCSSLKSLDLSGLYTSNVTNMSEMFRDSGIKKLDLSCLDTSNVTDMSYMFCGSTALEYTFGGKFTTKNVKNMNGMFSYLTPKHTTLTTLDLSSFDTSNVTSMYEMFFGSTGLEILNLSSFNTSKVTDMRRMFCYTGSNMALKTIIVSKGFVVGSSTNTENMFQNAHSIVGGNNTKYIGAGGTYAIIDGVKGLPGYFTAPTHDHQGGDNWVGYVDELHGKYCSVYGEPLKTGEHTYANGKCKVCDYSCQHNKIELLPNDDGTVHSGTCPTCNTEVIREHTYDESGKCSVCSYQCNHDTLSNCTPNDDDTTHSGNCDACQATVSKAHEYDENGSCVCGVTQSTTEE